MANYNSGGLDTLWWSPEEYAQLAQDLTKIGQVYEECVNAAAEAINSLGTSGAWTGYLFNQLIERFNEQKAQLDDDATMLTETIPTAISNQAQKQASANNGTVAPVSLAALSGIINPSETEDDGTGKVYIDPTTVENGINNFVENLNNASTNAKKYKELFEGTVAMGFNVSKDIKLMGASVDEVIERVYNFNEKFRDLLEQCATDSAHAMAAAQEESSSEAENIQ